MEDLYMKKFRNILWGLVLIILGLIFGGNALGITDINLFFDGWWTLFIIVPFQMKKSELTCRPGRCFALRQ